MVATKSQFKIQQMVFMLLAVFLFFILVGLFWITLQSRGLQKQSAELEQEKTITISQFLSSSSEFSCANEDRYCIDTDKLLILQEKEIYKEFWPVDFIKVIKLDNEKEKDCNKENYPDCNIYKVYENKNLNSNEEKAEMGSFVALCRYEQNSGYATKICDIGKIMIGY